LASRDLWPSDHVLPFYQREYQGDAFGKVPWDEGLWDQIFELCLFFLPIAEICLKLSELFPLTCSLPSVLMTWRYFIGFEPREWRISLL